MHIFVGPTRTWDRKLSSGWMMSGQLNSALTGLRSLTFMATHLLQFRFAVTEQYCLFTLTFLRTWVQELSPGLMSLTLIAVHLFQFRFAVADQYGDPSGTVERSTEFGHHWFRVARDMLSWSGGSTEHQSSGGRISASRVIKKSYNRLSLFTHLHALSVRS